MTYDNSRTELDSDLADRAAAFWGQALGPAYVDLFTQADDVTAVEFVTAFQELEARERRAAFHVVPDEREAEAEAEDGAVA